MITRRARGRPAHRGGDAGRDALIAAARRLLRSRHRVELSRKELAIEAGVTLTLISYYFKDQQNLIEAAVTPIIDGYLDQLRSIAAQEISSKMRFRSLVVLLLQVARNDGLLLEKFISYTKHKRQTDTAREFLRSAQLEFAETLHRCQKDNYLRQHDVATMQTAIWGICRSIALTPELSTLVLNPPSAGVNLEEWEADVIVDLLVFGLGSSAGAAVPPEK